MTYKSNKSFENKTYKLSIPKKKLIIKFIYKLGIGGLLVLLGYLIEYHVRSSVRGKAVFLIIGAFFVYSSLMSLYTFYKKRHIPDSLLHIGKNGINVPGDFFLLDVKEVNLPYDKMIGAYMHKSLLKKQVKIITEDGDFVLEPIWFESKDVVDDFVLTVEERIPERAPTEAPKPISLGLKRKI